MAQSVVVLEKDPGLANLLAGGLGSHFSVHLTESHEQLRENLTRTHPEAVVVNLEHWRLADVERLHEAFPALTIVCTHRIPDEEMWMAALSAGACDVCPSGDVGKVLMSILRSTATSDSAAA
jgi:DNA-binding NtrC family response regulator